MGKFNVYPSGRLANGKIAHPLSDEKMDELYAGGTDVDSVSAEDLLGEKQAAFVAKGVKSFPGGNGRRAEWGSTQHVAQMKKVRDAQRKAEILLKQFERGKTKG